MIVIPEIVALKHVFGLRTKYSLFRKTKKSGKIIQLGSVQYSSIITIRKNILRALFYVLSIMLTSPFSFAYYWNALPVLPAYEMSLATKRFFLHFWEYFTKYLWRRLLPYCLSLVLVGQTLFRVLEVGPDWFKAIIISLCPNHHSLRVDTPSPPPTI